MAATGRPWKGPRSVQRKAIPPAGRHQGPRAGSRCLPVRAARAAAVALTPTGRRLPGWGSPPLFVGARLPADRARSPRGAVTRQWWGGRGQAVDPHAPMWGQSAPVRGTRRRAWRVGEKTGQRPAGLPRRRAGPFALRWPRPASREGSPRAVGSGAITACACTGGTCAQARSTARARHPPLAGAFRGRVMANSPVLGGMGPWSNSAAAWLSH